MNERLDHLVASLASAPTDRSLDALEAQVGRAIGERRARARTNAALAPVGLASVAIALSVGATVGGLTAASALAAPTGVGAFSVSAELAPSTLIEGGR